MALNPEFIFAQPLSEVSQHYDARDTILYALGAGAGAEPEDLKYVYEKGLQTLPTMSVVLASSVGKWFCDPRSGVELHQVLHGGQELEIHRTLAPSGVVVGRTRIDAIYDKGPGKNAVVVQSRTLHDAETDTLIATARASLVIKGGGGFRGHEDRSSTVQPTPARSADLEVVFQTRKEQAALYRLSGDLNPLHIDPAAALRSGLQRPILHGLCSYAIAGRAIVRAVCADDQARLRSLSVRFVAPVFPGETLAFEVWRAGEGLALFRAKALQRQLTVLGNGIARYDA